MKLYLYQKHSESAVVQLGLRVAHRPDILEKYIVRTITIYNLLFRNCRNDTTIISAKELIN